MERSRFFKTINDAFEGSRDVLRDRASRFAMAIAAGSLVLSACSTEEIIAADGEGYDCSVYVDAGYTYDGIMRTIYPESIPIDDIREKHEPPDMLFMGARFQVQNIPAKYINDLPQDLLEDATDENGPLYDCAPAKH